MADEAVVCWLCGEDVHVDAAVACGAGPEHRLCHDADLDDELPWDDEWDEHLPPLVEDVPVGRWL